jgi:hypothetical protein
MNDPPAFNTSEPSYLIDASTSGIARLICRTVAKAMGFATI